jgi:hypothetical protein
MCRKRYQSHMKASRVSKDSPGASSDGRQSPKPSNSRFVRDATRPGTWATILLLSGEEKNTLYRVEDGRLRKASEVTIKPGSILGMRADTVHVVECVGNAPTIGLHVYGGDIFELPRRMWHPQTLDEHPLDWTLYENFARIASEAPSAPAP